MPLMVFVLGALVLMRGRGRLVALWREGLICVGMVGMVDVLACGCIVAAVVAASVLVAPNHGVAVVVTGVGALLAGRLGFVVTLG